MKTVIYFFEPFKKKTTKRSSSLLASSPWWAKRPTRDLASEPWGAEERRACNNLFQSLINFHFCFAQPKRNTIVWKMMHHQLILIDDIPGINDCHTFRNTMLFWNMEEGILWLLISLTRNEIAQQWTISKDCVAVFFTIQFRSQPLGKYKLKFWGCLKSMLNGNHKQLAAKVSHRTKTNQLRNRQAMQTTL